ncbi:hypothetical protein M199_gp093 [Halogranum tailed virus 1]|uniref:Uncharacterized protein n=1 Tax=Halogranum tailed virus 1 TaxID=1273749 RepID=R4TMZ5_9CAUD|nr:hypothetical protein M199_gp093 [Halogranum tailed virus 1]AGM11573.1 hypothetical protein HGTV1_276 [Halogranum tailed virus 1]
MEGFQKLDVFKGVKGNGEGVVAMAIISDSANGEVRVAEKTKDGYHEYVKPLSEISQELNGGVLIRAGKQAPSVEKARSVLSN